MTNKKLKFAAMSVALTACVAAQPLMANAADAADAVENDPPSEPAEETAVSPEAAAEETPPDAINEEAKAPQETFGEDTDVVYHPDQAETDEETGSVTTPGDVIHADGTTDKTPEAALPQDDALLDKAERTETDENAESTVTPDPGAPATPSGPSVIGKDEDGNTTITTPTLTPGTETTTTTGSGTAESHPKDTTTTDPSRIDLKEELGDAAIDWDVSKDDAIGSTGYKVDAVKNEGDQQTLTLKKEETTKGEMSAEDIAKLVDAEYHKVEGEDGAYTLTRTETYTDEDGVEHTRTTSIKVKGSEVETTTTTILMVRRERVSHGGSESIPAEIQYPEITVTDTDDSSHSFTLRSDALEALLQQDKNPHVDGSKTTYTATDEEGREYTITVDREAADKLTAAEIAAKLGSDFQAEGNKVYYIKNGEKAELSVDQTKLLREKLSITVTVKQTITGTETKTENGTSAAAETTKAQTEAIRNALSNAVDELLRTGKVTAEEAAALKKDIGQYTVNPKGDTFETTIGDRTFQLDYTEASVKTSVTERPDSEGKTDIKDNTVNSESHVTTGRVTWSSSENYTDLKTGSYTEGIRPDFDFKAQPDDATDVVFDESGYIKSYKWGGKLYEFTYDFNANVEGKDGTFTTVRWTVTTPESTETTDPVPDTQPAETFDVSKPTWSKTENQQDHTFDFTYEGGSASGLPYAGKDADGNDIYTKTDADGTVTTITIRSDVLDDATLENALKTKYGSTVTFDKASGTYTYTETLPDGSRVTHTGKYNAAKETLNVEIRAPQHFVSTGFSEKEAENALLAQIEAARKELKPGEKLLFDGTYEITPETTWEQIKTYVRTVVNYNALSEAELIKLLEKQKADAIQNDSYYDGGYAGSTWYQTGDGTILKPSASRESGPLWGRYTEIYVDGSWVRVSSAWKAIPVTKNNYIGHLDLGTDASLTLIDKNPDNTPKTDDCVLIDKTLEWNKDAGNLVKGIGNTTVGLIDRITYDNENDNDPLTGHYEFPRASWDGDQTARDNNPSESVFYKLTGTVAYGQYGSTYTSKKVGNHYDYTSAKNAAQAELDRYKAEYVAKGGNIEDLKDAQVVEICADQSTNGERSYKIYLYKSSLTAYGYLSDQSNTCGNAHADAQNPNNYVGGYDLTIGDLTQIDKEHIVAQGKNVFNYSATLTRVSEILDQLNQTLHVNPQTKTTTVTHPECQEDGTYTSGTYTVAHSDRQDFTHCGQTSGIEGCGKGFYTTFLERFQKSFFGKGEGKQQGGSFSYQYKTEKDAALEPVSKTITTIRCAKVDYTYTTIDIARVLIPGETTVILTPETPDVPDETPDTPDLPAPVVQPPVQEVTPAHPSTPDGITIAEVPEVQPVQRIVPAVSALPKTGVNWKTALNMAFSGIALLAAGAFTSRTRKGSH